MNNKNGSKDLIWYMFGCICNGATSAVILIATTWISGSDDAGIVTFAFTVAQQMLLIGRFEVRSFQITDAKDQFSFSEYYTHRIIFGFIMIMFSFIYVLIRKDGFYKGIVILLLCFYKLTEAISDVFQGNFQKNNMLEKAGKTMVFRECLFMICYVSGLIVSANLVTACLYGTIAAFLWIFFFDFRIENKMQHFAICFSLNKIYVITKACFPIFVGIFANTYLINASKYMIDRFWGDTIQSYYSMIFLPVSIINMLAIIIFFPLMTTLAGMWGRKEYGVTIVVIKKVVLVILCITIIICILGSIIGIPILETVYNYKLDDYYICFIILLLGGGCVSISGFLNKILIMIRKQMTLMFLYISGAFIEMILSWILTERFGIYGSSLAYLIGTFVLMILLGGCTGVYLKKARIRYKQEDVSE